MRHKCTRAGIFYWRVSKRMEHMEYAYGYGYLWTFSLFLSRLSVPHSRLRRRMVLARLPRFSTTYHTIMQPPQRRTGQHPDLTKDLRTPKTSAKFFSIRFKQQTEHTPRINAHLRPTGSNPFCLCSLELAPCRLLQILSIFIDLRARMKGIMGTWPKI